MASRSQADAVRGGAGGELRAGVCRRRATRALGALAVLLGLTVIVSAGVAQPVRATAARGRTWKIEPTPNVGSAEISVLSSVACTSRSACTAVGSSAETLSTPTLPLAERWDGRRWRIQPTPAPRSSSDTLFGVSCPSADSCVAVGSAFYKTGRRNAPLAEVWNGNSWRVQATPAIKGQSALYAVSCTSRSACMAVGHTVGGRRRAIVERWDGSTWGLQAMPRAAQDTQFAGVSCPKPRACFAVGFHIDGTARPVAVSWDGKRWQVQAVPLPTGAPLGMLDAVSCTSPRACMATGTDFDPRGPTLAERWDGKTWRVERTPNPSNYSASFGEVALDGVSCTSARACSASGEYSPDGTAAYFIESWNGTAWRLESTPRPADLLHGALLAMSCAAARCTAVGAYTGLVRIQVTLAMAG